MTISILLYLSTAVTTAFLFQRAGKREGLRPWNFWLLSAIGLPTVVSGLRWGIGSDYFQYLDAFVLIRGGGVPRFSVEFGFVGLNALLAFAGFGPRSILIASALVTMSFVAAALMARREIASPGFGALTFMLLFYQSSFNNVRMMLAVAIVLYNFTNIENRRLGRYVAFGILAASFHISALLVLPLYVLFVRGFGNWSIAARAGVYGLVILGSLNFDVVIEAFASITGLSYYENYSQAGGASLSLPLWRVVLFMPLVVPGLLGYRECRKVDSYFPRYFSVLTIGVLITLLAYRDSSFVDRFGQYFLVASVFVVPVYFRALRAARNYFGEYLLLLYLFLFWSIYYGTLNSHQTIPYRSVLQF